MQARLWSVCGILGQEGAEEQFSFQEHGETHGKLGPQRVVNRYLIAVLRRLKSKVLFCLQYASETKQKILSRLRCQNEGQTYILVWQFWFLCIQKNNNGGKGQRKGTWKHLKGTGTSRNMMIDRKWGVFWPYWQEKQEGILRDLLNLKGVRKG